MSLKPINSLTNENAYEAFSLAKNKLSLKAEVNFYSIFYSNLDSFHGKLFKHLILRFLKKNRFSNGRYNLLNHLFYPFKQMNYLVEYNLAFNILKKVFIFSIILFWLVHD